MLILSDFKIDNMRISKLKKSKTSVSSCLLANRLKRLAKRRLVKYNLRSTRMKVFLIN